MLLGLKKMMNLYLVYDDHLWFVLLHVSMLSFSILWMSDFDGTYSKSYIIIKYIFLENF